MNKLQIAKNINTLAGTQGVIDTTENVTGYQSVLILLLDQAYTEIQKYRAEWKFMKKLVQAPLNVSLNTYSNTDISKIDRVVDQVAYKELKEIPYEKWIMSEHSITGPPIEWTKHETNDTYTFTPPDDTYLVDIYYWSIPDVMTENSSIPVLPVEFHNLIVYKALVGLGSYLGNFDLTHEYSYQYDVMMGQMMRSELESKQVKTLGWVI